MTEDEVKKILKGDIVFDIPNFERWNPPVSSKKNSDTKKRNWFKLDVHWFDDPKFKKLSALDEGIWLKLVALRARSLHGPCTLDARYVQALCKVRGRSVHAPLLKLVKSGLLILEAAPQKREEEIRGEERRGEELKKQPPETTQTANLSPLQISNLEKQFGKELVEKHLGDAIALWEIKSDYEKQKIPLILTVQRYLKIERERGSPVENKFTAEEMAKIKALEAEFEK